MATSVDFYLNESLKAWVNWFNLDNNNYEGGSSWGLQDLQFLNENGLITMKPNINLYRDNNNEYWRNGTDGNKLLHSSAYNEISNASGISNKAFRIVITEYTLDQRYTFELFALLIDPNSGYSTIAEVKQTVNSPGKYTITTNDDFVDGYTFQYGIRLIGRNANPDTNWGSVKFYIFRKKQLLQKQMVKVF